MKIYWDWKHNWRIHVSVMVMFVVEAAIVVFVLIPHNDGLATSLGIASIVIAIVSIFFYCKVITNPNKEN